jgi:hypothetical protein
MTQAASITLEREQTQWVAHIQVHDQALLGRSAHIHVIQHGETLRSGGHQNEELLSKTKFVIRQTKERIVLPGAKAYSYQSPQIAITIKAKLVIDDGVFFDTKIEQACKLPLPRTDPREHDTQGMVEPSDQYSFKENLKAIPVHNRLIALFLAGVGGLVIALNVLVGTHDQFTATERSWFYDQSNSKGESESPLMKALAGSGGLAAVLWLAVQSQLRRYAKLQLNTPKRITRDTKLAASQLISGSARVPLEGARIRIVAYNNEFGRYTKGSGKDRKTQTFRNPIRSICLFDQLIEHLPARSPINSVLQGDIYFDLAFDTLYPPVSLGDAAGIELEWELQLLHAKFVDHEVSAKSDLWVIDDFWYNQTNT